MNEMNRRLSVKQQEILFILSILSPFLPGLASLSLSRSVSFKNRNLGGG